MEFFGITYVTPTAAFAALLVVAVLAAHVRARKRKKRAEEVLREASFSKRGFLRASIPFARLVALGLLLAFVLATPVRYTDKPKLVRSDVEIIVLCDNSRSMLAASSPKGPTRWDRFLFLAANLRKAIPEAAMGLTCFTDRPLPYLFPTTDEEPFLRTLTQTLGVGKPPPKSGSLVTTSTTSSFEALSTMADSGFFSPDPVKHKRRIIILMTDGEMVDFQPDSYRIALAQNHIRLVIVHIWRNGERVFWKGKLEPYRSDPQSRDAIMRLANATNASVYADSEAGSIASGVRSAMGKGPMRIEGKRRTATPIAWYGWIGLTLLVFWHLCSSLKARKRKSL